MRTRNQFHKKVLKEIKIKNNMETTKILSDEHKNILKVIDSLNDEIRKLSSGREINKDFLEKAVEFIRQYADKFHHAKEEDILFKEFCKAVEKGEVHCNPVEQMLSEHESGRSFVKGIEEGLNKEKKIQIIENVEGYTQLLQEHIFKEDKILYPMIDGVLSLQVQEGTLKKFNQIGIKKKKDKLKYEKFAIEVELK
jgi:hemerythrin-like domain-containing protein